MVAGTPDEERGRVLAGAAELVRAQADRLARLESLDVGKPIAEAQGDVDEAARILEYYAGWPTKAAGDSYRISAARCARQRDQAGEIWINDSQIARCRPRGAVSSSRVSGVSSVLAGWRTTWRPSTSISTMRKASRLRVGAAGATQSG